MAAADQRVPELVGGIDIRTLPLTAVDGFVLSRIDGRSSAAEIVAMTGLGAEQVQAILDKLVQLGAIRMPGPPPASSPPRAPARTPPPRSTSLPPHGSSPPRRRPSQGHAPRKLLSESSISAPPPDMRSFAPRARASTPAIGRTPVPGSPPRAQSGAPAKHERGSAPSDDPARSARSAPPGASAPPRARPAGDSDATTQAPRSPFERSSLRLEPPRSPRPEPPYDPRELEEAVDLPPERRKQVLELFHRLRELNYYEVLGVPEGADKKEIRAAYFSRSKVFHTDSMFRKELGSYKAKMTAIFQAMTEAYDALSRKKSRDEYDAYLRSTRSIKDAERALATEDVARADVNVEVPRPPPLPSTDYELPPETPVPVAPEPPREASPEARRIARELLERRLRGLPASPRRDAARTSTVPGASIPPAHTPAPSSPADRQELARRLARTLVDVSKVTGSADKLTRAISAAKSAFERGDLAESVQHMARAFSLAPERADLHAEYERLSRMLAEKLADDYAEQARFEAKQGHWAAAAISWAKVCEGRPEDSQAHRHAAFALLKAGSDQRGAQRYAQRAVFLAPDDIDARILLAQAYLTVGLKLNARRELDAAAKLDPENEMVKNLLSDLKA